MDCNLTVENLSTLPADVAKELIYSCNMEKMLENGVTAIFFIGLFIYLTILVRNS